MLDDRTAPSDAEVIAATLGGNAGAFDALVERYFAMVFAVALARLGNRSSAEDLTQEVFLRAFLNLGKLKEARCFGAWLTHMTRNLAIDWLRSGQTASRLTASVPLEDIAEVVEDSHAPSPREVAAIQEETEQLRAALLRLPEPQRELVQMHYLNQMSKVDMANRLGVHPSTVGRQLAAALEALRQALEQEGGMVSCRKST
ncbi:MAG: sigma-70 family RNA polymerase sigma factor [Candidatus Sumerlaeaceae bacterium]|nr:sigma-70 family RNA polymerase sigma factor [Candidatus Sumerlaeaceae bacterium]